MYSFSKSLCVINVGSPYSLPQGPYIYFIFIWSDVLVGTVAVLNFTNDILRTFHDKHYFVARYNEGLWLCKCCGSVVQTQFWRFSWCICNLLMRPYLTNRDQYVIKNSFRSSVLPVSVGVPQGSVRTLIVQHIYKRYR